MVDITFEMWICLPVVAHLGDNASTVEEEAVLRLENVDEERRQFLVVDIPEQLLLLVRPLFCFNHVGSVVRAQVAIGSGRKR